MSSTHLNLLLANLYFIASVVAPKEAAGRGVFVFCGMMFLTFAVLTTVVSSLKGRNDE